MVSTRYLNSLARYSEIGFVAYGSAVYIVPLCVLVPRLQAAGTGCWIRQPSSLKT